MVRRTSKRFGLGLIGSAFLVVVLASPSFAVKPPNLTIGPQAMEGDLKVNPGDVLSAGFDFTMPGSHPDAYVAEKHAMVTFNVECVSGSGGGTVVVSLYTPGYIEVPENSSDWFPSGDQHDPSVYQGSLAMPDLCSGGQMTLKDGGTFSAYVFSTDVTDALHFRFHYSANGSSGSWSATVGVTPYLCHHQG